MRTPIQELINRLDYLIGLSNDTLYEFGLKVAKKEAEQMIKKEKRVMIKLYNHAALHGMLVELKKESPKSAQRYYNETFNTKER